jgi:hypothetical protein
MAFFMLICQFIGKSQCPYFVIELLHYVVGLPRLGFGLLRQMVIVIDVLADRHRDAVDVFQSFAEWEINEDCGQL